jgi:hypothetical protein
LSAALARAAAAASGGGWAEREEEEDMLSSPPPLAPPCRPRAGCPGGAPKRGEWIATAGPQAGDEDEGEGEELEGEPPRCCWKPPPPSLPSPSSGGERVAIRAASRQTSALTKMGAPQRRARLMPSEGRLEICFGRDEKMCEFFVLF